MKNLLRKETDLSAPTITKSFPIVCGWLKNGEAAFVGYYGDHYKITRHGPGKYDVTAKEICADGLPV